MSHNDPEKKAAAIAEAIAARGVTGVAVSMSAQDSSAYLVGEVHSAAEEAIAVDAALEAGATRVQDGLHYPGAEKAAGSLVPRPQTHGVDPALDILRGAHLESRTFDASDVVGVRTGTPID